MADNNSRDKKSRLGSLFGGRTKLVSHDEDAIDNTPVPILDMSHNELYNITHRAVNDDFSDDTDDDSEEGFGASDEVDTVSTIGSGVSLDGSDIGSPGKKRTSMFSWARQNSPPRPEGSNSSTSLPRTTSSKQMKGLKERIMSISELSSHELDDLAKTHTEFDDKLKFVQKDLLKNAKVAKDRRKTTTAGKSAALAKEISSAVSMKKKALKELKKLVAQTGSSALDDLEAEGIDIDDDDDDISVQSSSSSASSATSSSHHDKSPLEQLRHFEWKASLLKSQHTALNLDTYFPQDEGWKMRIYIPEEDMYMGAKDVGIEKLKLTCNVHAGVEGVQLEIKNLEFFTTVYQMRFKGKSSTAAALKKLMSPEMVRLGIYGTILIHAEFLPKKNRWRTKKCSFDLHVNKRISGAMTAPDMVVRRLINGILPPLVETSPSSLSYKISCLDVSQIRRIVAKALPAELGSYFNRLGSDVHLGVNVNVAEEISKEVWTSPLLDCEEARLMLKVRHRDIACLCAILAQGHAGKASGINPATLSIQALYTYILKYHQRKGGGYQQLLTVWNSRMRAVAGERVGDDWMTRLLDSVHELGRRPLAVEVVIEQLDAMVNIQETIAMWSELYLKTIHSMIKRAKDQRLPHVNFKSPEKILSNAVDLVALVDKWVGIGCEALQRAAIEVDVELQGGDMLKASFGGRELEVSATIPGKLQIATPRVALDIPGLDITSEVDEESGGLSIEVAWNENQAPPESSPPSSPLAGAGSLPLVLGKLFLASLGVGLKNGKLLLTSDELSGRVALQSALITALIMPAEESEGEGAEELSLRQSRPASSTEQEVQEAVIKFIAPILFSDAHELSVTFNQLLVNADTPNGRPGQLEVSVKATEVEEVGRITLKLDVAKILTDVLDIVELQNRLYSQGIL